MMRQTGDAVEKSEFIEWEGELRYGPLLCVRGVFHVEPQRAVELYRRWSTSHHRGSWEGMWGSDGGSFATRKDLQLG
jgi:hypothetical protein